MSSSLREVSFKLHGDLLLMQTILISAALNFSPAASVSFICTDFPTRPERERKKRNNKFEGGAEQVKMSYYSL